MNYRIDPQSGIKLSILGFGCMRFPRTLGRIDIKKSEKLILEAVNKGINYFDTAWLYMGSEEALGTIINKNHLREKIFIATKLPLKKCKSSSDFDRFFQDHLDHLQTDYIDYYLMHSLSDMKEWNRLCHLGIEDWIEKKKRSGQIKQLGFSYHGNRDEFETLLNAYNWDFTQIQYNYVNTHYQAGTSGLKKAAAKGMPVIIMEPLLGGKLAVGLPKKAIHLFKKQNSLISPAEWSLRWLWDQQEVTVVLSGMNDSAQLEENITAAEKAESGMLTEKEQETIKKAVEIFRETYKIPCTGCNYCMPCPQGINIPACFSAYNISFAMGKLSGLQQYITSVNATDPEKRISASACIQCGKCEKLCPQHIPIASSIKDVSKRMETLLYKAAVKIMRKVLS